MDHQKLQYYFLASLLLATTILVFFVLQPFLYVFILSLVCVSVFWPLHQRVLRLAMNNKTLAAIITTLIIIAIILLPLIFLGIKIFQETQQFYLFVTTGEGKDIFIDISNSVITYLQTYLPLGQEISIDFNQYLQQGLKWTLVHLGYIFGSITNLLFNFFVFIVTTFYLLSDGPIFLRHLTKLSPLTREKNALMLKKIHVAINSIIKGSFIIAIIQGALTALGLALFGIQNPILWGTTATVASLLPGIGTATVFIPVIIFAFFTKSTLSAIGLLIWGGVIVGLIDNLLKPKLISNGINVHPLIVFLSVIGGIIFFGPLGFLLGPLAVSFLFILLDMHSSLKVQDSQS